MIQKKKKKKKKKEEKEKKRGKKDLKGMLFLPIKKSRKIFDEIRNK